jgi:urease accessory protein
VIDICAREKMPGKDRPGITKSDLLITNKIDIADQVHASLDGMEEDSKKIQWSAPSCSSICVAG